MEPDFDDYVLEGDPSPWAQPDGLVIPIVTRAGSEDGYDRPTPVAPAASPASASSTPRPSASGSARSSTSPATARSTTTTARPRPAATCSQGHGPHLLRRASSRDYVDMTEGDWVFVPPFMPHVECNMSTKHDLVWLTTRTPDNIVVNLADVDDSDARRASAAHERADRDQPPPRRSSPTRWPSHRSTPEVFDEAYTATTQYCPWPKAYGGDMVAQATVAAMRSVEPTAGCTRCTATSCAPSTSARRSVTRSSGCATAAATPPARSAPSRAASPSTSPWPPSTSPEDGGEYAADAPPASPAPESLPSSAAYLAGFEPGTDEAGDDDRGLTRVLVRRAQLRHAARPGPGLPAGRGGAGRRTRRCGSSRSTRCARSTGSPTRSCAQAALAYACDYTILEPVLRVLGPALGPTRVWSPRASTTPCGSTGPFAHGRLAALRAGGGQRPRRSRARASAASSPATASTSPPSPKRA